MNRITKDEYKKVKKALDFFMNDLITEKEATFYDKVIRLSDTYISKENNNYIVLRKYQLEENNERRDFHLIGKLKEEEITINIDEKIVQGELDYSRIRYGKYTIEDDLIKKECSHLYYVILNDVLIPIEDRTWTEEKKFFIGDNDLLSNYNNIIPVKKDVKRKSLHKI